MGARPVDARIDVVVGQDLHAYGQSPGVVADRAAARKARSWSADLRRSECEATPGLKALAVQLSVAR